MPERPRKLASKRKISLTVDGKHVGLNGFVQDVFQEVVLALIRSLGTVDGDKPIELRIEGIEAPAPDRPRT